MAVQPDGKVVVVGYDAPAGTTQPVGADVRSDFVLRRYNADGSADLSFGAGGVVVTDFYGRADQAMSVALDSKSRIVVAGKVQPQGTIYPRFGFARYLPSGKLDESFGQGGKVLGKTINTDGARGVAVGPDDGVVAAGTYYAGAPGQDFLLERLNPDGTPDAGFGDGGSLTINFGQNDFGDILTSDYAADVTVTPLGKIVVAGGTFWPGTLNPPNTRQMDVAVARLMPDGTFDPTFGEGGKVAHHFGGTERAGRVAVLADDSLALAGSSGTFDPVGAIFRLTAAGAPVATFDGDGMKLTPATVADVAPAPGGGFFAAGAARGPFNPLINAQEIMFSAWRFTAAGTPDTTFDGDGQARFDVVYGPADAARAMAVLSDGAVVLAGAVPVTPAQNEIAVVRLTATGTPDAAFGDGGKVVTGTNVFPGSGRAIARQPDGKYLVAGLSDSSYTPAFRVTRFNADGTLDHTFGDRGTVRTPMGGEDDSAIAVHVRPDGRIWVGGFAYVENAQRRLVTVPALARYLPDGRLDTTFDGDGKKLFPAGAIGETATATEMFLQPDGKLVFAGSGRALPTDTNDVFLMRVLDNGDLDASFGTGGVTWQSVGVTDTASQLIAVPGDFPDQFDYVVTGSTRAWAGSYYEYDAIAARFNHTGALQWARMHNFTRNDLITASAVNPADGSILLAGHTVKTGGTDDLLVAKLTSSGDVDGSFGAGGHVILPFVQAYPWINAAAFDAEGGAILAGYGDVGTDGNYLVMRMLNNGSLDAQFGNNGKVEVDVLGENDRGIAMLIQPDGKIVVAGDSSDPALDDVVTSIIRLRGVNTLPVLTVVSFEHGRGSQPPHSLRLTFDVPVGGSLSREDVQVRNLTTGSEVPADAMSLVFDESSRTATVTFPGLAGGVLPDGNYRATLAAGSVQDSSGKALGSDAVFDFFVLAGDANQDRRVGFEDLVILAQNYNTSEKAFTQGDFNYDGNVGFGDLVLLAQRYGTSLAAAGSAPDAAGPTTSSFANDWPLAQRQAAAKARPSPRAKATAATPFIARRPSRPPAPRGGISNVNRARSLKRPGPTIHVSVESDIYIATVTVFTSV